MQIATTSDLVREFGNRASQCGLNVECPADGTFNASIAIVAEAPGDHEVTRRIPLIGPSGSVLFKGLRSVGLNRHECYVTNVSKRQVAFSKNDIGLGRKPLKKQEMSLWTELLLWELSQLPNLKYVVAAGNFALEALTGKDKITQWRGSVLSVTLPNSRVVTVICTFNPAMVIRDPKTEISFTLDMRKIRRVIEGKHKPVPVQVLINPSYKDALMYIQELETEGEQHETPIAFDLEVISMETACVGLANSKSQAICINWRTRTDQRYSIEEERTLRRRLQRLMLNPKIKLIAQNGMFDTVWSWYKDKIYVPRVWFDTMLAHHTLYPTLPHNLGYLTTQYTDHPFYKDEKDEWREGGSIDSFWEYNGKDCCHTWEIAVRELRELEAAQLDKFFFSHVMRLQPHLARMTVAGVKIDVSLKESIKEGLHEDLARKLHEFHGSVHDATADPEYNPNPKSPTQLSELFFRRLKLVGRGPSTDAANRKRMFEHPRTSVESKRVITTLNSFAKDSKFFSTYAEMRLDPDDRARSEYKQTGVQTAPGRLSSTGVLWGSGMNFQNQPPRAQPMFIADPGCSLGYFDGAQGEARLVAYFADIPLWKEQFERARIDGSYDAHRALASEMWDIPYNDVPTNDTVKHDDGSIEYTLRYRAKRCRHGLNYRMQPDRLAETANMTPQEAQLAFNLYHRATPELRKWWQRLEREIRQTKTLFNAFGRRMIILERITDEALESIVAFKPQSTLGDHVCMVIYLSYDDPRWPRTCRFWMNIHDALIIQGPHDDVPLALSIAKKYMETPIVIGSEQVIIPGDTKISVPDEQGIHRWSTLKKADIVAAR